MLLTCTLHLFGWNQTNPRGKKRRKKKNTWLVVLSQHLSHHKGLISSPACCGARFLYSLMQGEKRLQRMDLLLCTYLLRYRGMQSLVKYLSKTRCLQRLNIYSNKATTAPIPPTGANYFLRFASAAHSHVRTRHRDGLTEASGPPASKDWFLFSASNFGFQAGSAWTVCACCQVCVNISSAAAALMAGLWIVSTVMVKHGQASDVRPWVCPKETANALAIGCVRVCVCVLRCV